MSVSPQEILIIDDDEAIYPLLKAEFELEGFVLSHEANGLTGLDHALNSPIALAIVDVNLPGLGGFEICRRLKAVKSMVPILLLTTRNEEADKLIGFERGADDYVTKPFSVRELRARVQALLRRGVGTGPVDEGTVSANEVLSCPGLEVRTAERRILVDGTEIVLTRLEFDLMFELMKRAGTVVSRDTLSEVVWDNHNAFHDPTITATISRLRKRLNDVDDPPRFIETIRGIGYRFIPTLSRRSGV